VNCNAVPKGATAHLGSDETVKYAAFQQLILHVLHAILKCPMKTVTALNLQRIRDQVMVI